MKKMTRILNAVLLTAAATTTVFAGGSSPDQAEGLTPKPAAKAPLPSDARSASFRLPADVKVGGVPLKTGRYRIEWSGEGTDVQVAVLQGKKELVRLAGQLVTLDGKANGDTLVTKPAAGGGDLATELRFGGKTIGLRLAETPDGAVAAAAPRPSR